MCRRRECDTEVLVDELTAVRADFARLEAFLVAIVAENHREEKGLRGRRKKLGEGANGSV